MLANKMSTDSVVLHLFEIIVLPSSSLGLLLLSHSERAIFSYFKKKSIKACFILNKLE